MFNKVILSAAAIAMTASMAVASAPSMDAPAQSSVSIETTYETADTRGMDNRQDRRGDRQDCRQVEGAVGHDKRDCKQSARG